MLVSPEDVNASVSRCSHEDGREVSPAMLISSVPPSSELIGVELSSRSKEESHSLALRPNFLAFVQTSPFLLDAFPSFLYKGAYLKAFLFLPHQPSRFPRSLLCSVSAYETEYLQPSFVHQSAHKECSADGYRISLTPPHPLLPFNTTFQTSANTFKKSDTMPPAARPDTVLKVRRSASESAQDCWIRAC